MTYSEIQQRLKELGDIDTFGTKKEIKELPDLLYKEETIEYLTSGTLNGNTWLVVCTNKRILFVNTGLLFGCKQLEIPLEKVNSVETTKGLLFGKIRIWDGASSMVIDNVGKSTLQPFVNAVNNARDRLKDNNPQTKTEKSNDTNDYIKELERLAELKDKGIITEEEFLNKKKQILGL